jgi:hypothetical protein
MKDRAGLIHGDNDCRIVCPSGPPPSCPIYACSRRFQRFGEDMSRQEPVKKKSPRRQPCPTK